MSIFVISIASDLNEGLCLKIPTYPTSKSLEVQKYVRKCPVQQALDKSFVRNIWKMKNYVTCL